MELSSRVGLAWMLHVPYQTQPLQQQNHPIRKIKVVPATAPVVCAPGSLVVRAVETCRESPETESAIERRVKRTADLGISIMGFRQTIPSLRARAVRHPSIRTFPCVEYSEPPQVFGFAICTSERVTQRPRLHASTTLLIITRCVCSRRILILAVYLPRQRLRSRVAD